MGSENGPSHVALANRGWRLTVRCSIVIPTWQRAEALRETLVSLAHQFCTDFEVFVVSDGEDPPTRALSEIYTPPFQLRWIFHPQNQGQGAARNTGVQAAQGEILLFLDDDTPADPDLVSQHALHSAHSDPYARFAIYGKTIEDRQAPLPQWTDKFLQQTWERNLDHNRACIAAADTESIGDRIERAVSFGMNCSIRRDTFLLSGLFNPQLRFQDEDMELGHRLYRAGVRFQFNPLAIAYHRNSKSMTQYFRRCWEFGGRTDAQRVFQLNQRNPQTRNLVSMCVGPLHRRLVSRITWQFASALRDFSSLLERATNRTGSRLLFAFWDRLSQRADYWTGVKAAGVTPSMLGEAAGEPGCALMFHSLSLPQTPEERTYYLSPAHFRRSLQQLKRSGYTSASVNEWVKGNYTRRRPLLTFDDGYDDLYTELLPAIREFKLKPLVFLIADRTQSTNVWDHARGLRQRNLLTLEQIREMQRHGVEFGSHTFTHPWLPDVDDAQLRREVQDSKRALEDVLGVEVRAFAYPYGGIDQRVRAAVADAGYQLAFTTVPGLNHWTDPLCLHRADINQNDSLLDFRLKLRYGYSPLQWSPARLRALENDLPTETLRSLAKRLRVALRPLLLKRNGTLRSFKKQ